MIHLHSFAHNLCQKCSFSYYSIFLLILWALVQASPPQSRFPSLIFFYSIFYFYNALNMLCISRSVMSQLFATPWTVAHQAPLSMGFPRQEYWSGLPFSSPGDLSNSGFGPGSPVLQADSLNLSHQGSQKDENHTNIQVTILK